MNPTPPPPKTDGIGLINAASLLAKMADSADEEKETISQSSQSQVYERTEDGSYKCPQCTRTFPKLVALKSHIIMHSDVRKHGCEVCGKKFARRHDLLRHLRTVHASTRLTKDDNWQTQYYKDKRPRLDPLEIYTTETPPLLSASSDLYSHQQEMTPTSADMYDDYRRKSSAATEPLLGHRPSLTEKVLSHRISAPTPSTFIPPECVHGLGIGYCRICPQDIGKVPFDRNFKCVHDKLAHFCRSCRNEGYWRKLEEERRRRSMGMGVGMGMSMQGRMGEHRLPDPRMMDQRVFDQRMMMDQRGMFDQRAMMDQRVMMDQRGIIDHRLPDPRMIDQRVMVDQRVMMDPRGHVDQRGMIDPRGLIDQRNLMDQRAILEHRGIMEQRIIAEKRASMDQRVIEQPGQVGMKRDASGNVKYQRNSGIN